MARDLTLAEAKAMARDQTLAEAKAMARDQTLAEVKAMARDRVLAEMIAMARDRALVALLLQKEAALVAPVRDLVGTLVAPRAAKEEAEGRPLARDPIVAVVLAKEEAERQDAGLERATKVAELAARAEEPDQKNLAE